MCSSKGPTGMLAVACLDMLCHESMVARGASGDAACRCTDLSETTWLKDSEANSSLHRPLKPTALSVISAKGPP